VVGFRGPPSPVRTYEDVFGMKRPAQDQSNWRVMGNTTTDDKWHQLSASKREDRYNREGLERYETATRASNAEQSRISPRFTEERYLQQGATPATPSPGSAYEDRYPSQKGRTPTAPTTLNYGLDTGYGQCTSSPATQPRPNLSRTRRRCYFSYT
jgi:hypothetical protein